MIVRLSVNKKPISGYVNIDPRPLPTDYEVTVHPNGIENIDNIIGQAECLELIADDCINHVPGTKLLDCITNWVSKLRHNGKLTITGNDAEVLCKAYLNGELDTKEFNEALFEKSNKSCFTSDDIGIILTTLGLRLTSKQLQGHKYIITAKRP
jgi:hypothetical protein